MENNLPTARVSTTTGCGRPAIPRASTNGGAIKSEAQL